MIQQFTPTIFFNHCFDKRRFQKFLHWFFQKSRSGQSRTLQFLEKLKSLGLQSATAAGFSISIEDLKIPSSKSPLLLTAENLVFEGDLQFASGCLTKIERFQQILDIWNRTSEKLKYQVLGSFQISNFLNPVYLMAFSGARGNISQIRQLVGMRGLMADPQGQIVDFPIRSNFREGLTLTEYLISCSGARKGIVDTALRTAASGYLTRRLVDVAHHVIISQIDCQTTSGILIEDLYDQQKKILCLQERLVGRLLAETIFVPLQKSPSKNNPNFSQLIQEKIGSKNQEISKKLSQHICQYYQKVRIRSPLTCRSSQLICQLCYGWNLAEGQCVSIGEAVGVLAAQSIGEPGTQLTMRTFHTGGVFTGRLMNQTYASFRGKICYPLMYPGTLIRTQKGKIAFLTKNQGIVQIFQNSQISQNIFDRPPLLIWKKNRHNIFQKKSFPRFRWFRETQFDQMFQSLKSLKKNRPYHLRFETQIQQLNFQLHSLRSYGRSLDHCSFSEPVMVDHLKKSEKFNNQISIIFQTSTLLYSRQGEIVEKQQLIAELPSLEGDSFFENEQDILSPTAGEMHFENFIFLEKTLFDFQKTISLNQIPQKFVQGLGEFWILFGQVFRIQHFSKNASFIRKYDLIDHQVPCSQIQLKPDDLSRNNNDWVTISTSLNKVNSQKSIFFQKKDPNFSSRKISYIFFKKRGYLQLSQNLTTLQKMFNQNSDWSLRQYFQKRSDQNIRTWRTGLQVQSKSKTYEFCQSYWKKVAMNFITHFPLKILNFQIQFQKNRLQIFNKLDFGQRVNEHKDQSPFGTKIRGQLIDHWETFSSSQKIQILFEGHQKIQFFNTSVEQKLFFHENLYIFSMNRQGFYQWVGQNLSNVFMDFGGKKLRFDPYSISKKKHFRNTRLIKNRTSLQKGRQIQYAYSRILRIQLQKNKYSRFDPKILWIKTSNTFFRNFFKNLKVRKFEIINGQKIEFKDPKIRTIVHSLFRKKCHLFLSFPKELIRQNIKKKPRIVHWKNLSNQKYFILIFFLKKLKIRQTKQRSLFFDTLARDTSFLVLKKNGKNSSQLVKETILSFDQFQACQVQRWLLQQRILDFCLDTLQFTRFSYRTQRIGIYAFLRIFLFFDLFFFETSQILKFSKKVLTKTKKQSSSNRSIQKFHKFFIESILIQKSPYVLDAHEIFEALPKMVSPKIDSTFEKTNFLKTFDQVLSNQKRSFKKSLHIDNIKEETIFNSQFLIQNQLKKIYLSLDDSRLISCSLNPTYQWGFLSNWEQRMQNTSTYFQYLRLPFRSLLLQWKSLSAKIEYSQSPEPMESKKTTFFRFKQGEGEPQTISRFQLFGTTFQAFCNLGSLQKIFPLSLTLKEVPKIQSFEVFQISQEFLDFYFHSFFSILIKFRLIINHQKRFDQRIPQKPIYCFENFRLISENADHQISLQQNFMKVYADQQVNLEDLKNFRPESTTDSTSISQDDDPKLFFKILNYQIQQNQQQEKSSKKSLTITFLMNHYQRLKNSPSSHQSYCIRFFKSSILQNRSFLKFRQNIQTKIFNFEKNLFFDQGDFYLSMIFPQKNLGLLLFKNCGFFQMKKRVALNILKLKIFSYIRQITRSTNQIHLLNSKSVEFDWLKDLRFQISFNDQNFQLCLYGISPIFQNYLSSFRSYQQPNSLKMDYRFLQSSNFLMDLNLWFKRHQILRKTYFLEFHKIQIQRFQFLNLPKMSMDFSLQQGINFEILKKRPSSQSFESQIFIRLMLPFQVGEVLGNEVSQFSQGRGIETLNRFETFSPQKQKIGEQASEILIASFDDFFSYFQTPRSLKSMNQPMHLKKNTCFSVRKYFQSLQKVDFLDSLKDRLNHCLAQKNLYQKDDQLIHQLKFTQKPKVQTACLQLGSFHRTGEEVFTNQWMFQTGQIIAQTKKNILFRKAISHLFNHQSVLHTQHGEMVFKDQRICTVFYHQSKTGDIVQGIPKIEEIFEARKKSKYSLHELSIFSKDVTYFEKKIRKYLNNLQISVVNNIQRIYCSQGVHISDKHIEIIVRQMTSNALILDPGQTGLLYGELVSLQWISRLQALYSSNHVLYEPVLIGMTKTCLETSSFLSAASFQETTRILSRGALLNQMDFIRGLKQNIILGNLIPAGTGCFSHP